MCRCPTFVRAAPPPSTSLTYIRTHCRTSLEFTTVLHSYVLLVCHQHHRFLFIHVAKPRWYAPLSYFRMRCSSAVYIADLRSYALQNLVGIYHCPTFVHAAHLPSTSLTYVRTHCRTPLVCTAVRHLYVLRVCRHYRWLHLYALLFCHQHRRPLFVCIAEPCCYIPTLSVSAAMTAGYIRTLRSPAVIIANLRSDALQNVVGMHRCPTFICCSFAVNIAALRLYALQNLVGMHRRPTFVRAARLPSTSPTSVRTCCRTSLVCTACLHSYMLLVCRRHR